MRNRDRRRRRQCEYNRLISGSFLFYLLKFSSSASQSKKSGVK
jgi:hypothetical protein